MQTNQQITIESINALECIEFIYLGETLHNDWKCDAWKVTVNKTDKSCYVKGKPKILCFETFDYFTGIGHRKIIKGSKAINYPNAKMINGNWQATKLEKPDNAAFLYSIVSDASLSEESFEDFCANCGYDTDSRKALETYLQCQQNFNKLKKVFTYSEIEQIKEALQDY